MPIRPTTSAPGAAHFTGEVPARRCQDVVELARVEVAALLARCIGQGALDRSRYQNWLAMESVVCRIGALSLDAVAGWHGAQPACQAIARAWSARLREDARAAAYDVRALDGMADGAPAVLRAWHAFAVQAGGSQRAGEALGAVVLHDGLFGGPMRPVAKAIADLPFGVAARYLHRRLDDAGEDAGRAELLDAYAAASLAAGAQRAAKWYVAATGEVLGTAHVAAPS